MESKDDKNSGKTSRLTFTIPLLGCGTYRLAAGSETFDSVAAALKIGYRHVDTATLYGNQGDVGRALDEAAGALALKEPIFVCSKVCDRDQKRGRQAILDAVATTLSELRRDCLDLLLLHSPAVAGEAFVENWQTLEYLVAHGKVKQIGVSNFEVSHLLRCFNLSLSQQHQQKPIFSLVGQPAVNQIEWSPFLQRDALIGLCRKHEIAVCAHSALTKGRKLAEPCLVKLSKQLQLTPAQVLVQWTLRQDAICLVRSRSVEHLLENWRAAESTSASLLTEERIREMSEQWSCSFATHPQHVKK